MEHDTQFDAPEETLAKLLEAAAAFTREKDYQSALGIIDGVKQELEGLYAGVFVREPLMYPDYVDPADFDNLRKR